MDKLIRLGSISREAAVFLRTAVRAGYNIFVSLAARVRKNDIFKCFV